MWNKFTVEKIMLEGGAEDDKTFSYSLDILPLYNSFVKNYSPDFSLAYPDKVILPLEEFAQFYFRSSGIDGNFAFRKYRAFNDSFTKMWQILLYPRGKPYDSIFGMIKDNMNYAEDFATKALFSRHLSRKYVRSEKSVAEIMKSEERSWLRLFRTQNAKHLIERLERKIDSFYK